MTWTLKLNGIYKQYWFINNKCLQIGKLLDIFWKPTVLRKKISTDSWNHSSVNAKRNFCCIITSKNYCNQIFFSPSLISIWICCIVSISKHSLQSFFKRLEMKEDFQIIQYKLMIPINLEFYLWYKRHKSKFTGMINQGASIKFYLKLICTRKIVP